MKLDAIKRLPRRKSEGKGAPVEHLSEGVKSRDIVGSENGESGEQIRRYIRLTELLPELFDMVDEGRIAFKPAVDLSYGERTA